jgi:hypothetical protein
VNQIYGFTATVDPAVSVEPGNTASVNLTVTNTGNGQDEVYIEIVQSEFNATAPEGIALGYKAIEVGLLHVSIPFATTPHNFNITIGFSNGAGNITIVHTTVTVLQVHSLSLSADEYNLMVLEGENAVFHLEIVNTGNGRDQFILTVTGGAYLSLINVTLDPGESRRFTCTISKFEHGQPKAEIDVTAMDLSGSAVEQATLIAEVQTIGHEIVVGDFSCLWILLVALAIFLVYLAVRHYHIRRVRRLQELEEEDE